MTTPTAVSIADLTEMLAEDESPPGCFSAAAAKPSVARFGKKGLFLIVCAIFCLPPPVYGGENCAHLGGRCRNACLQAEQAEAGAFEDCGETQDCCVTQSLARSQTGCCILSFDARHYGPENCILPESDRCLRGSGSPVSCELLLSCKKP